MLLLVCISKPFTTVTLLLHFTGTSTENNPRLGSTIPIIAGGVGGVAIFITILLCSVILYVRKSYKTRSCVNNKMATELNSDVTRQPDAYYNTTELSEQNRKLDEHLYDYVIHDESVFQAGNEQHTLRMQYNPSYGRSQESNTADHDTTHQHSYYNLNLKSTTGISEDEYYVETDLQYHSYTDVKGYLEIIGSTTDIPTKIN